MNFIVQSTRLRRGYGVAGMFKERNVKLAAAGHVARALLSDAIPVNFVF
jgi:hypothetical protein